MKIVELGTVVRETKATSGTPRNDHKLTGVLPE
jgi:hypothetical protein